MRTKHLTKTVAALAVPVLFGAVAIGCTAATPVVAASAAENELYANGGFDNFFEQDYDLTLRNWNTFTSLASSDAIGEIALHDDPAFVGYDPSESNHAMKLGHTERAEETKPSYMNTFYSHFNTAIASVSNKAGTLIVSFDLMVADWEEEVYNSSLHTSEIPPCLYFEFEGVTDNRVYVSPEGERMTEEGLGTTSGGNDTVTGTIQQYDYSDFAAIGTSGYRRVTATFDVDEAHLAGSAFTVWFTNKNLYTAYLDNFEVRFDETVILSEDFETFDLTIWACSNPEQTDPWKNWGISPNSENSSYSPARLIEDDGDYAVRFQRRQGKFTYSKRGTLVDYFVGGSKIFSSAGTYRVSADIKITGEGTSSKLNFELTDADNVQTQGIYTNLLSGGKSYYDALPDSTARAGYKHLEYTFSLDASQSQLLDSVCFVFDTVNGADVLWLDNLSVTPATAGAPKLVWNSGSVLDLSARTNYLFATDIGTTDAALSVIYNGTTEPVSSEYFVREGNVFNIDYRLFDFLGYTGEYEFTVTNNAGSVKTAVSVSGETGLPSANEREVVWYKSGDLSVGVDLKGARILSIENEGITLQANEYTLSKDGDAIILRENCLKALIDDENRFIVETSDGSFSFTVVIREATEAEPEGLAPWAIGVIVAVSMLVVAGLAVGGVMLYKNKKKGLEEKTDEKID